MAYTIADRTWSSEIHSTQGPVVQGDGSAGRDIINNWGPAPENELERRREILFQKLDFAGRTARELQIEAAEAAAETFEWIWTEDSTCGFSQWLSSKAPLFWICGKPGSGKSTLVQYLAESDRTRYFLPSTSDEWLILHFYFDFRAGKSKANDLSGLVQTLLLQLLTLLDAESSKSESQDGLPPKTAAGLEGFVQIRNALLATLRDCPRSICIFIDGLDEFEGKMADLVRLLKSLVAINEDSKGMLKFCFASRPHVQLDTAFRTYPMLYMQNHNSSGIQSYLQIVLGEVLMNKQHEKDHDAEYETDDKIHELHEEDDNDEKHGIMKNDDSLDGVVDEGFLQRLISKLKKRTHMQDLLPKDRLPTTQDYISTLAKYLVEKAEGVFIWARFAADDLIEAVHNGDNCLELVERLEQLPAELEELYDRVIQRLTPKYRREGLLLLNLVASWPEYNAEVNVLLGAASLLLGSGPSIESPGEERRRRLRARTGGLLEILQDPCDFCFSTLWNASLVHKSVLGYISNLPTTKEAGERLNETTWLALAVKHVSDFVGRHSSVDTPDLLSAYKDLGLGTPSPARVESMNDKSFRMDMLCHPRNITGYLLHKICGFARIYEDSHGCAYPASLKLCRNPMFLRLHRYASCCYREHKQLRKISEVCSMFDTDIDVNVISPLTFAVVHPIYLTSQQLLIQASAGEVLQAICCTDSSDDLWDNEDRDSPHRDLWNALLDRAGRLDAHHVLLILQNLYQKSELAAPIRHRILDLYDTENSVNQKIRLHTGEDLSLLQAFTRLQGLLEFGDDFEFEVLERPVITFLVETLHCDPNDALLDFPMVFELRSQRNQDGLYDLGAATWDLWNIMLELLKLGADIDAVGPQGSILFQMWHQRHLPVKLIAAFIAGLFSKGAKLIDPEGRSWQPPDIDLELFEQTQDQQNDWIFD